MRGRWKTGKTSGLILKISLHSFLWHLTSSRGSFMLSNDLLAIVEATTGSWKQDSAISLIINTRSLTRLTWFTVAFLLPQLRRCEMAGSAVTTTAAHCQCWRILGLCGAASRFHWTATPLCQPDPSVSWGNQRGNVKAFQKTYKSLFSGILHLLIECNS